MGDIRRDWKFKMDRFIWPTLMLLCFLGALVTMPRGVMISFSVEWLLPAGFFVAMLAFWSLCVWDGRWGG